MMKYSFCHSQVVLHQEVCWSVRSVGWSWLAKDLDWFTLYSDRKVVWTGCRQRACAVLSAGCLTCSRLSARHLLIPYHFLL